MSRLLLRGTCPVTTPHNDDEPERAGVDTNAAHVRDRQGDAQGLVYVSARYAPVATRVLRGVSSVPRGELAEPAGQWRAPR
jgi:hypothetical protein